MRSWDVPRSKNKIYEKKQIIIVITLKTVCVYRLWNGFKIEIVLVWKYRCRIFYAHGRTRITAFEYVGKPFNIQYVCIAGKT